jgi:RHS repeat-associated protein
VTGIFERKEKCPVCCFTARKLFRVRIDLRFYPPPRFLETEPLFAPKTTRKRPSLKRRAFLWTVFLPLILLSGILANWATVIPPAFAAPHTSVSTPGSNTLQQFLSAQKGKPSPFRRPSHDPGALPPTTSPPPNTPLPSAEPAKMKDLTYVLDNSFVLNSPTMAASTQPAKVQGQPIPAGTTPFQIKGSDGRLEVDLPRSSLDFTHATLSGGSAPVGQLFLRLHQVSGHFLGADSVLGTYQIQILDSQGNPFQGIRLAQPLTIVYHYQPWELQDLDIDPTQIHLAWTDLLSTAIAANQPTTGLVVPMVNDSTAQTLTVQSTVLGSVLTASSTPEIAAPAKPDLFEVSGNSGQYAYTYPLAVPPGPDGFAPHLLLTYSSQSTNGRHSRRAPASDAGEGFSLSLGSITKQSYPASSTGGAATWYSINGVDGVSDKLVPEGSSGYYMTEHVSNLSIFWIGDHWRVYSKDGTYYELGKNPDSQQKTSSGVYEWDLDKVLAPFNSTSQVKTMFIKYYQDSPDGGTTIRDAGIKQIQYGFATSNTATSLSLVSGTVDFHYHAPNNSATKDGLGNLYAVAYGTNYHCSNPPSSTTLRCDDPGDFGAVSKPNVMATMTLDSVTSYVGIDSNNQPAYRYDFTYQDSPYTTNYYDPATLTQEAAAGEHLLTQITPTVYLGGAAHQQKSVVFGYTGALHIGYRDPSQPIPGTSPTQYFTGQTFWQYLNFYEDLRTGTGARISYTAAHANMNGTPYLTDSQGNVTDDRFDPLYCTLNKNNSDPSKQCTGNYANYDDYSWGLEVVTQISALGTDSSGNTTVATTNYAYALTAVPSNELPVETCHPITGTGVPAQEADCVGDNWVPGYNGTQTPDHDGDWQDYYHSEFRGFNIVYTTGWSNDLTVDYYFTMEGWWVGESGGLTYNGGQRYQEDVYQGDVETPSALLKETRDYYTGVSVPSGGAGLYPHNSCHGSLSPVYTPCEVSSMETKTTFFEGQTTNAPWVDIQRTYDDLPTAGGFSAGYHNLIQQVTSSSNAPTVTQKWQYKTTDIKDSSSGWQNYYDVDKVSHREIDDASGHVWQCQDTSYDQGSGGVSGGSAPQAGWPTTTTTYSTCGNSSTAMTSYTGYDQYGNVVATVDPLAAANPSLYSGHGCTLSQAPTYLSTSWTAGRYTSCTAYDTSNTAGLPVTQTNALGQTTSLSYDYTSGAQLTSTTDPNNQPTSYSYAYDSGGNETITTNQPGETGSYTSRQVENSQCVDWRTLSSPQDLYPCYEIDSNNSLYPNAVSRTFYDALGRAVETRTPGPTPGDDTVVMTVYNDQAHTMWQSEPFQVADGSGWIDPSTAKDINGNTPAGTTTFYDALGRALAKQDLNFGSSQEPGIACSTVLSGKYTSCTNYSFGQAVGDTTYYALTTSIDPNGHVTRSFADGLGNVRYTQATSGVSGGTLTVQQQTQTQYNALNKPTSVTVIDEQPQSGESPTGVTTTMTYDDMGRLLTEVDPDQGTFTYSYDPDGHTTSVVQTSGSNTRTLGTSYDLLGRVGCEQTAASTSITWNGACSAGNPLVQNTYDTTVLGTQGSTDFPIGHLTQSVATTYYPDSTSATVTQQYQTDQRGRTTNEQMQLSLPSSWNVTSALPGSQLALLYNDANQVTTTSATAGTAMYTFTQVYDPSNGALQGLSNNGSSTANLAQLAYTEFAQLAGITYLAGSSTQVASVQYSYDGDLHPTSLSASWLPGSGNSGLILSQGRTYDNASNVTSVNTTMAAVPGQSGSGGSETQNFCYDEQNRLIWAGNSGTQPGAGNGTCGSGTLSSGLNGAGYSAPYTYTNLGQIWQGPIPGNSQPFQYLYCNSAPHELSGIYLAGSTCSNHSSSNGVYLASYDAWGNLTSRTYNSVIGTLSYDQLNHLVEYSDTSNNQEQYVYDASGERVLKRSTSAGSTTLTAYPFGLQELTYSGNGVFSSQLDYYSLSGHLIGWTDGASTTYDLTDAQGSVLASFSASAIQGEQLYSPYGTQRYTVGILGTDKGYTGQFYDNVTGLDYYHARYYDPVAGVFLSPDRVQGNAQGMDPYGYVIGNPETNTDPSGQRILDANENGSYANIDPSGNVSIFDKLPLIYSSPDLPYHGVYNVWHYTKAQMHSPVSVPPPSPPKDPSPILWGISFLLDPLATVLFFVGSYGNACGGLSFSSTTKVATDHGEQAIGTLRVGEKVWAYNTTTHKMELQPIVHVWINHDNDLVDLTLTIVSRQSQHGKTAGATRQTSEVLHTNKRHPFLTTEEGFIPVSQLKPGMHVLRADGGVGVVTGWKLVPGVQTMYNLEVQWDHTYTVGNGQWIVHNCGGGLNDVDLGDPNGFGSVPQAISHFDSHGWQFGSKDWQQYEQQARNFMAGKPGTNEYQIWNPTTEQFYRWNSKTGEFGIYNPAQGRMVSYYKIGTGAAGEAKFAAQYWATGYDERGNTTYSSSKPDNPTLTDIPTVAPEDLPTFPDEP